MKYFVFDYTNDGIIWVGQNLSVANKIKEGIIDTDMTQIGPLHPVFDQLSADIISKQHYYWDHKNSLVKPLDSTQQNPVYLEKRRLAQLRNRALHMLVGYVSWSYRKTLAFPYQGIDNELRNELDACIPTQGLYSKGIQEYASICGLDEQQAYKTLNLKVQNFTSQRIRSYSYFEYFSHSINQAENSAKIEEITAEMYKKFVKDSYI